MAAFTIVFDQDCGVCQASVAWLKARDRDGAFEFLGNESAELPAGISRGETDETVFVVERKNGSVRSRADGIAQLLRALPGPSSIGWRMLGAVMRVPGPRQLSNFAYRIFAKHRHRVSAAMGLDACGVPLKR